VSLKREVSEKKAPLLYKRRMLAREDTFLGSIPNKKKQRGVRHLYDLQESKKEGGP